MNVTIDVDLTPSEARELMRLPNVKPLHDAAMAKIEQRGNGAGGEIFRRRADEHIVCRKPRAARVVQRHGWRLLLAGPRARETCGEVERGNSRVARFRNWTAHSRCGCDK